MNGLIFIEFQWIKQLIVPRCGDSFNYKSEANLHPFVRIFSRMERFEVLQGFLNLVPITRRSGPALQTLLHLFNPRGCRRLASKAGFRTQLYRNFLKCLAVTEISCRDLSLTHIDGWRMNQACLTSELWPQ